MSAFPAPSPFLAKPADAPWVVGIAHFGFGSLPYPLSRRDIERDTAWAMNVYEWLGLEPGRTIHLIGDGRDEVSWWPFESAAMSRRIPWIQAESAAFDASRTDMILRRFKLQAVIGLTEPVPDALIALERDLKELLGNLPVVVATPAAAKKLALQGITSWKQLQLGPVLAFEPPEGGGARYDESEWRVDAVDGELALSSVHARACPIARLKTGLRGRIDMLETPAGRERRIVLE